MQRDLSADHKDSREKREEDRVLKVALDPMQRIQLVQIRKTFEERQLAKSQS